MGRKETVELTNMCMVEDGKGNVLVQNRLNPNWPGIVYPGGHVEAGESITASVVREVRACACKNRSKLSFVTLLRPAITITSSNGAYFLLLRIPYTVLLGTSSSRAISGILRLAASAAASFLRSSCVRYLDWL